MLLALLLTGCGATVEAVPVAEPVPPPASTAPVPPPSSGEPVPTPPSDPDAGEREDLLQTRATDDAGAETCQPEQLALRLGTVDVALGHRFTQLVARNTSETPCLLRGTPGLGAQGMSGAELWLELENRDSVDDTAATHVRVEPGEEAYANLEWTGALAGAGADHLARFIVQFASGQQPVAFLPPGEEAGHPANRTVPDPYEWEPVGIHDLGSGTTVRIGPWRG